MSDATTEATLRAMLQVAHEEIRRLNSELAAWRTDALLSLRIDDPAFDVLTGNQGHSVKIEVVQ